MDNVSYTTPRPRVQRSRSEFWGSGPIFWQCYWKLKILVKEEIFTFQDFSLNEKIECYFCNSVYHLPNFSNSDFCLLSFIYLPDFLFIYSIKHMKMITIARACILFFCWPTLNMFCNSKGDYPFYLPKIKCRSCPDIT